VSRLSDTRESLRGLFITTRAAVVLAAGALVVPWLPGFWAWVVAIVWFVVWFALVRSDVRRCPHPDDISVRRRPPVKCSVGVSNAVTLTIEDSSARGAVVSGRETPPAGWSGQRDFGPVELGPRGERDVALAFVPPDRGSYEFGDVGLSYTGPYGLAGRRFDASARQEVKVYPDITAVHSYALLARRGALHEIGVRAARYQGAGTEFESLREYESDDDYRDIDWKATARAGNPIVRRFEPERSQTIVLAVDAGRLMTARIDGLSKLDRAINAALLLSYLGIESGDNVGLLVFARDVQAYLPPKKGHRQFLAILEALYAVEDRLEEPDYAGALRYLATRLSRRSLVVLFTELVGTEPSRRLLGVLGSLTPRHLPLVITQRNRQIEDRAVAALQGAESAFEASVAQDILRDKDAALRHLVARGSLVLDVEPERLSVAAVNRYLEVKARGRL
jgi:uncharacterized protein (DUF58 family)